MRPRLALVAAAAVAVLLSGCGEKAQVVVYKQGKYQGKPDEKPWENERFSNKMQWEESLKTRALAQNEYKRTE